MFRFIFLVDRIDFGRLHFFHCGFIFLVYEIDLGGCIFGLGVTFLVFQTLAFHVGFKDVALKFAIFLY